MRSILVAVALLAAIVIAEAQQTKKVPKIGYLSGSGSAANPGPYVQALREGLRGLGHIEGKTLPSSFAELKRNWNLSRAW